LEPTQEEPFRELHSKDRLAALNNNGNNYKNKIIEPLNKFKLMPTFMIATLTRVACVVVLVTDLPLKSLLNVLVLMATPNLDLIALELEKKL
jgi:hypothetical protein